MLVERMAKAFKDKTPSFLCVAQSLTDLYKAQAEMFKGTESFRKITE